MFESLVATAPAGASLRYVNGAVPSTGPPFFAACLEYRVPADAALVLLEFTVNGLNSQASLAGMEGTVRRLLQRGNGSAVPPALLLVDWFTRFPGIARAHPGGPAPQASAGWFTDTGAANSGPVGEYYDVPRVSMRSALLADDVAATPGLRFEDWGSDWSHPNAAGHALIAEAVVGMLARALEHAPREHGRPQAPLAASAVASGERAAVAALPPLVPGNCAETLHATCRFGEDLRSTVSAPPRGWLFDEADPLKPGWRVDANASDAEFSENALTLRFDAYNAGTAAFVAGWDSGDADFSCAGNCSCQHSDVRAYRTVGRVMEQHLLRFDVGGAGCELTVRARADSAGHRGFKLMALIVGGPADTADELYYGVDTITGDGRGGLPYGAVSG